MRALSEDALDTPSASQGKDPRALPKTPAPSASGTRAIAYNLPGPPGQARMYYALTHTSAISQQRPLLDPQFSTPDLASLRDSEFSRLVESKDPEALKSLQQGPNEDLPSNDSQRFTSPSPGGYRQKAATPTRLNHPDPSPPPPGIPMVLPHFRRGSLIDLGGGRLKRVEELQTEDFLLCPNPGPDVHLSTCTILLISPSPDSAFTHLQVLLPDHSTQELLEVLAEYPFFVRNRGWSSCCPQRTAQVYGLHCHQLRVGDVCLALIPTPARSSSSSPPLAPRTPVVQGGKGFGPQYIHTKVEEEKPPPRSPPTPPKELPRTRKRRWSAPELQGEDTTPQELPHSSKHRRQQ
ncbi:ataxin-1-like [Megalops cyprinoides]|uniref:ataxin-1-like n=1 Tax=Megalops cyprinoides TaxID=118141 RepID=UPI0018640D9C|nr:ataxin-1-like [Megalops cyprinoides]